MDISKTDKAELMAEAEMNAVEAEFEERTPEIVAAEIRQIADQTRKMVLNSSIEIGKRLCEAKEMVPHGEWAAWLEKNVDFSQSSANNFMKIYTEYGDIQGELWGASAKSQTFGNLSYSQAVALLAVPAEEREEFVKENHVEDMSTRELQEAIKARDEAVKERDKAREELQEAVNNREKVIDSYIKEEENKIIKLQKDIELANTKLKIEQEGHNAMMDLAKKEKEDQLAEIERLKAELAAAETKEPEPSEEMQAEIERLKEKLKKAEQLGAERLAGDEELARFKVLFQTAQNNFSDLIDAMYSIRNEDKKAKGKAAIRALFERLTKELDTE
jgi:hypothetical protein